MKKYLLNTVVCYRVDTVEDALELRDELQAIPHIELVNFSYTTKFIKSTEEEYQVVKAKLKINEEKDPDNSITDIQFPELDVKVEF